MGKLDPHLEGFCTSQNDCGNNFEVGDEKCLSEVGFEPTPTFVDQNTHRPTL